MSKSIKKTQPSFLLKDMLFSKQKVVYLAELLNAVQNDFNNDQFIKQSLDAFVSLELKERMTFLTKQIDTYITGDYKTVINKLIKSLPKDNIKEDFIFGPYCEYVATFGCDKKYLNISFNALSEFTSYFSGEFAIRDFINQFPDETLNQVNIWSKSKLTSQRRLASEGSRPKLPWAKGITLDYKRGSKVLDNLFYDNERYITRSVANHINDLSKIDADYTLSILKKWKKSGKQNSKEMDYIINHGTRTLIKKGNVEALNLIGFKQDFKVEVNNFIIKNETIKVNNYLEFSFDLVAKDDQNLLIDFGISFPSIKKTSPKVFKIKKIKLQKNKTISINKKLLFRPMTTRRLYQGKHILFLQINGKIIKEKSFILEMK